MATRTTNPYKNIRVTKGDTFLGKYMEMMSEQETPLAYDFWCALWLISLAVGRTSVVARPKAPVFLNLYAILCAESGVTRKSSAVRTAERIAGKFLVRIGEREKLLSTKMSPEALTSSLHERTNTLGKAEAALAVSELVTFLGKEKYVNAMPGLLTDLYDCPEFRQSVGTVARGRVELRNVWLSLLSASTPSWLVQSVNPNVVEGGFTSRCLFICAERSKQKVAWPEDSESMDEELVDELMKIRDMSFKVPEITLNENGLKKFKNWYKHRPEHRDPYRASFESREDGHVLKVAALLSINRRAWRIYKDDIENAIRVMYEVKEDGYKLFEGFTGIDDMEKAVDKLRASLLAAKGGGVFERELVRSAQHYATAATVRNILTLMHEMGLVKLHEITSQRKGVKMKAYVATKELLNSSAYERIVTQFRAE